MFYRCSAAAVAIIAMATASVGQTKHSALGADRFVGEVTIGAKPAEVWKVLTNCRKLCALSGVTHDGDKALKEGDHWSIEIMGDKGTNAITRAVRDKELRVYFDPDNGSYICQQRWLLAPSGGGTRVSLEERYTESGAMSAADRAKCIDDQNKELAMLKEFCTSAK